jgi:hypothetical protein
MLRPRGGSDVRPADLVTLSDVERVIVRRIWYPGTPLGRGQALGLGPVLILRFRFLLRGGSTVRVRSQSFAATLHPVVRAIAQRFAGSVEVARTLPGV